MSDRDRYVASNKHAWNEAAPRHAVHNQQKLREQFAQGGHNYLADEVVAMLEQVGITGKSVVQVACNNGKDLLSLKAMGAGQCLALTRQKPFWNRLAN